MKSLNLLLNSKIKLKIEGKEKPILIGSWLSNQRNILNKYRGKTKEEIEKDAGIETEEKRRVLKLLELGVSYTEEKTPEEIWNENLGLLEGLLNAEGECFGLTKEEVFRKLNLLVKYEPFEKFNMTCKETLNNCLYVIYNSTSFEDSIRKAISIGGDTDTIAAIVGSISESYYGIPENLKQEVKPYLRDYMYDLLKDRY